MLHAAILAMRSLAIAEHRGRRRLWTAKDLTHRRTIDLGEAWVTDCVWLPFHERLAVASSDHAVRILSSRLSAG